MVKPKFFITDVFTAQRYGGNPLATFIDCESLSDQEMQKIAKEINFSETTFITSRHSRHGGYDVRIFTPNAEVEFAGHPTLGTAYVIRHQLRLTEADTVILNLRVGQIPVTFTETPHGMPLLWMKQIAPEFGKQLDRVRVARMLHVVAGDIDSQLPVEEVSTGFPAVIVPLANAEALKRVKVNKDEYFSLVEDAWAKVILVYSRKGYESGQQLSVRVFADYFGVAEDAATGSSNGSLAAYLLRHGVFGAASLDVVVGQGYEMGRPSNLSLRASKTPEGIDVLVGGNVVAVAAGEWG